MPTNTDKAAIIKEVLDRECPNQELIKNRVVSNYEEADRLLRKNGCKADCFCCHKNDELARKIVESVE